MDSINVKLTRLANWRDVLSKDDETMPDPFAESAAWGERIKLKYQSLKVPYLLHSFSGLLPSCIIILFLMQALSADPKKVLDTQYDKRKTFIKIIDQWSDRLKRSFKYVILIIPPCYFSTQLRHTSSSIFICQFRYVYQSQREFEDFATPILKSKWRNEVVNITKLFSHAAFLDMKGPEFRIGDPAPLFDPERYFLWESDYPAAVAMYEVPIN